MNYNMIEISKIINFSKAIINLCYHLIYVIMIFIFGYYLIYIIMIFMFGYYLIYIIMSLWLFDSFVLLLV